MTVSPIARSGTPAVCSVSPVADSEVVNTALSKVGTPIITEAESFPVAARPLLSGTLLAVNWAVLASISLGATLLFSVTWYVKRADSPGRRTV